VWTATRYRTEPMLTQQVADLAFAYQLKRRRRGNRDPLPPLRGVRDVQRGLQWLHAAGLFERLQAEGLFIKGRRRQALVAWRRVGTAFPIDHRWAKTYPIRRSERGFECSACGGHLTSSRAAYCYHCGNRVRGHR
jgi:hypothetical protein